MKKTEEIIFQRTIKLLISTACWYGIAALFVDFFDYNETTYDMVCGYMFISMANNVFYMLYLKMKE